MTQPEKCHADGCDREARWSTKVFVDVAGPGQRYPIRTNCSIKVCDKHKKEEDVRAYLLLPQNRESITDALTDDGHPEPDFFSLKVAFEPIDLRAAAILRAPPPKCCREGCQKIARWQIKQLFKMMWQKKATDPYMIEVLTNLTVCDEHKALARPKDLLDHESKSRTQAWLNANGVSMPDFKSMKLDFVAIDGAKVDPRVFVGDAGPKDQFKCR